MGAGSSKQTESRFGYFLGAGYGYHHGSYNISDIIDGSEVATSFSAMGPVANAGIRFAVGRGTHNVEVRFQYMKGLNDVKPNIFSAGGAFNF